MAVDQEHMINPIRTVLYSKWVCWICVCVALVKLRVTVTAAHNAVVVVVACFDIIISTFSTKRKRSSFFFEKLLEQTQTWLWCRNMYAWQVKSIFPVCVCEMWLVKTTKSHYYIRRANSPSRHSLCPSQWMAN